MRSQLEAYASPMTVTALDGEVVILGPEALKGSFTPAAAEESARRLRKAVDEARRAKPPSLPKPVADD